MLISIYLIEFFRLINVSSLCLASALARDPVPMVPEAGTRVAFLTTIVPSREPIEVVRPTLRAAARIRHRGRSTSGCWMRKTIPRYAECAPSWACTISPDSASNDTTSPRDNSRRGPNTATTTRGSIAAQTAYDFFVSVDPDHVPLASFCERLLGYFRDPDVAFAVGPQVYGNYDNFVTKCAESQQFVFHGLIQRLGNYFGSPMFVGTNNAVRIAALCEVGGLRDSITEDLATSVVFHSRRNPAPGGVGGRSTRPTCSPSVRALRTSPISSASKTDGAAERSRTFGAITGGACDRSRAAPGCTTR